MVENIDTILPTIQGHSKKQAKLLNFLKIWSDSSVLNNFTGYFNNNTLNHHIEKLDKKLSSPTILNIIDKNKETNHSHQNGVTKKLSELEYFKTPSLYNRHKFNRLDKNCSTQLYPVEVFEKDSIDTEIFLPTKSNHETFHKKYDFHDLIGNLENDSNLRSQFISCLKKSTILSKSIIASISPGKEMKENRQKNNRSINTNSIRLPNDEKLPNNSTFLPHLDIDRCESKKYLFGPTENIVAFKRSMSYAIQGNERENDSYSSPALSPTQSSHSTLDDEKELQEPNAVDQAFDISSKRIEDELQRQLQSLNLNQQKLDMTLIKYQTEAKAGLDMLSPTTEILSLPRRAKTALSHKVGRALYSVCGSVQELFAELLDDDLIYLAKYTSDPVLIENYPPLTLEDQNKLERILHFGPKDEILVRGFGADIKRSDLNTLEHINWLNDEIMNFYLNMITERSKNKDGDRDNCAPGKSFPSVHSFSTFFFTQLSTKGYQSVRRWTKKVDIFEKQLIIVPVHIGAHWCMGIIDNVAKVIIYFDSLYSEPHDYYLGILLNYLEEESLDKKKTEFDTSDWKLINALNVPQQKNGSDCGMFALKYAEFCSRRENFTFNQAHMSYFRQRMVLEIINKKLSPL